jgi:DNA-binding SARP family transcriptional activator
MDVLRINLFGQLRVYRGDKPLDKFSTRKAQYLFCYLALHRRHCHSRNALAGLFWIDTPEEQARKCLRTTLWRLRSLLGPTETTSEACLHVENDEICFNIDCDYWLDVEEFEKCLARSSQGSENTQANQIDSQTISALARAVELYQGDLLEGCYEDWCLLERERLQGLFLGALARLMDYYRWQGIYEEALRCGRRILSFDPLLEEVHREVMRLHCLAGNRAAAVRQYHMCRTILFQELGIDPMEETTALYAQICQNQESQNAQQNNTGSGKGSIVLTAVTKSNPPKSFYPLAVYVDDALNELREAQKGFSHLSGRFQRVAQTLENIRHDLE